jgi:hypothetical protein
MPLRQSRHCGGRVGFDPNDRLEDIRCQLPIFHAGGYVVGHRAIPGLSNV